MPSNSTYRASYNIHPGRGELILMFSGQEKTDPGHQVGPKIVDYYLVHFVVSGQGVFHCRGNDHPVGEGDSFFIFPNEPFIYCSDVRDPFFYRWIGFKGTEASAMLERCAVTPDAPVLYHRRKRRLSAMFYQVEKILYGGTVADDLRADGLLRAIFAEWMDERGGDGSTSKSTESEIEMQILRAIRLFTFHYDHQIPIGPLAKSLGYDRTHFSKMFKQHTGLSPQSFLHKIRMEAAKQLLYKPLTIDQVARSVGFADPLYFSKMFKKWTGETPTDYRRGLMNEKE